MKKLLGILFLAFLLSSCTNYDITWKMKVYYQNGDVETLTETRTTFNGNKGRLYLSNYKGSSTLRSRIGGEDHVIATDVRRYEILSRDSREVKK